MRWGSQESNARPESASTRTAEDSSDHELWEEQATFIRPRKGAVCAEPFHKGYYFPMPFWNKFGAWERQLYETIRKCDAFKQFDDSELIRFVQAMEIHKRFKGEDFAVRGEVGDGMFVVLEGNVDCFVGKKQVTSKNVGAVLDEAHILFGMPRTQTFKARAECICGKLHRMDFINLSVRLELSKREVRQFYLRTSKLLEMMLEEQIAQLADVLQVRTYEPGEHIIKQGDEGGREFFILEKGEAVVTKQTADDIQEYVRYYGGELFGEVSLMTNAPRAASVTAVQTCQVLVLTRVAFERLFGSMKDLQAQQYLTDPRKIIADFYETSDDRGPLGSLQRRNEEVDKVRRKESSWFAVYRPTSTDAIAKMLSGTAVGKGLNVKGKSAKKGCLSGYVPFIQISDNKHKAMVENSPSGSKLRIYYKTKSSRQEAIKSLTIIGTDKNLDKKIDLKDDYAPDVFGIELQETLLHEAYINKPDLSPIMGWETGRPSEPAFMDMNLHAVREDSDPVVVLFQYDEADPMNPRGLLVAYAEEKCKPVVSDFDTFTVGSKNMKYEPLPVDQAKIINWALGQLEDLLNNLNGDPWTTRWLNVIKQAAEGGFHPKAPKYGYGDPTSIRLIGDIIFSTAGCGAIRHGAESCNFFFPQELDDQYLIVWREFPSKPWDYVTEKGLREFLLARAREGFCFPLNPMWPVRDPGWFEVLETLEASEAAKSCLASWFRDDMGISEQIHKLHKQHPQGFRVVDNILKDSAGQYSKTIKLNRR